MDTNERATHQHIVLTNLAYAFRRPCVLDVKLGTVLHDEETASAEKKARMEATAQATTSFETGIRLTGFQVREPWLTYMTRRRTSDMPHSPLVS
jgi:hypothetical protein